MKEEEKKGQPEPGPEEPEAKYECRKDALDAGLEPLQVVAIRKALARGEPVPGVVTPEMLSALKDRYGLKIPPKQSAEKTEQE